jgi:DNA replication protein DnaC
MLSSKKFTNDIQYKMTKKTTTSKKRTKKPSNKEPPAKKLKTPKADTPHDVTQRVEQRFKEVNEYNNKMKEFLDKYKECHTESASKFQLKRIEQKANGVATILETVNNKSTPLNIAFCGATGRGKSFMGIVLPYHYVTKVTNYMIRKQLGLV